MGKGKKNLQILFRALSLSSKRWTASQTKTSAETMKSENIRETIVVNNLLWLFREYMKKKTITKKVESMERAAAPRVRV